LQSVQIYGLFASLIHHSQLTTHSLHFLVNLNLRTKPKHSLNLIVNLNPKTKVFFHHEFTTQFAPSSYSLTYSYKPTLRHAYNCEASLFYVCAFLSTRRECVCVCVCGVYIRIASLVEISTGSGKDYSIYTLYKKPSLPRAFPLQKHTQGYAGGRLFGVCPFWSTSPFWSIEIAFYTTFFGEEMP